MYIYIYEYIYMYIIYVHTYNQLLLKSSFTERKQVSWFLIFFKIFSESFVIKYKIYDCYTFFLFEIQEQIL